jgi:hypothetical protein
MTDLTFTPDPDDIKPAKRERDPRVQSMRMTKENPNARQIELMYGLVGLGERARAWAAAEAGYALLHGRSVVRPGERDGTIPRPVSPTLGGRRFQKAFGRPADINELASAAQIRASYELDEFESGRERRIRAASRRKAPRQAAQG